MTECPECTSMNVSETFDQENSDCGLRESYMMYRCACRDCGCRFNQVVTTRILVNKHGIHYKGEV